MANYSTAAWEAFQYKVDEDFQKPEFKHKPSTALMQRLRNTDMLIPASEKERVLGVKQSDQDTVYFNMINLQSITTGSARAYNHTGSINDSTRTEASFTTVTGDFTYSIKGSDRNIWALAEQVSAQLRSTIIAIHADLETACVNDLSTNKSQVERVTAGGGTNPMSGTWDGSNYIFQIRNEDYEYYMQKLKGFMREQYYKGMTLDVLMDEVLFQKAEQIAQQGSANYTNLGWQLPGLNFDVSEDLSAVANYEGTGYVVPAGTYGIIPWIPELNREGYGDTGKAGGFYTKLKDPLGSGLEFAVHEWAVGADNDGAAGETQDVNIHVELSVDYSLVKAPMSTSNASPIFQFGVKDS